jgi:hypothetical protein
MKKKACLLVVALGAAGCARMPERAQDLDAGEERLQETLGAAQRGPSTWSPALTIPLYPVLLVANTSMDVAKATYRYVQNLFGGGLVDPSPVPERIEKQAEKLQKN